MIFAKLLSILVIAALIGGLASYGVHSISQTLADLVGFVVALVIGFIGTDYIRER